MTELEKLQLMGSESTVQKIYLAYIYADMFKADKAEETLNELRGLIPRSKELEIKLYILFSENKLENAMDLLDKAKTIGPVLFTKINDVGIQLSADKQGDLALKLYDKAHPHVVRELRYKVSLNAAIAAYKNTRFDLAIKYANTCEKELGFKNEKAEKNKNNFDEIS